MKAVIPVAGAGIRLRPLTYTQPKPLIPVAGKPILSFIIDQLIGIGIQEFVFVIGYLGEKIRDYVEHAYPEIQKEFVQQEMSGLLEKEYIDITQPALPAKNLGHLHPNTIIQNDMAISLAISDYAQYMPPFT